METGCGADSRGVSYLRFVIAGAVITALLFAVLVYFKAVRLRQGDQDVFFRAGWSIRQGGSELYETKDVHGWHFHYPPLFAILMVPLADVPDGVAAGEQGLILPLVVRVMVLYLINLACLVVALRLLLGCLPNTSGWTTRRLHLLIWPVVVCLPVIGLTLIRGQVDLVILLLIAGFVAGLASARRFTAGLYLAAAISIKIIPAFLLILPLWRRDRRCLAGCAFGLFLGLWLIPAVVMGPRLVQHLYAREVEVVLGPAMGVGEDGSRSEELLDARATVNHSFQMILHLTLHLGQDKIPPRPAAWMRGVHWLMVALLTFLVLWRQGRALVWDGQHLLGTTALLTVLMVLASPVCHLHYFTLAVPLAMAVVARILEGKSALWGLALIVVPLGYITFMLMGFIGSMFPPLGQLRDLGLPMYATLALWLTGWWILHEEPLRQAVLAAPVCRAA
jgi:hypothetical protein